MLLSEAIDISFGDDLDPYLRTVSGLIALKNALLRRLSTQEGGLALSDSEAVDYGYSLTSLVGRPLTGSDLALAAARISAECLKDARVADCRARVELDKFKQILTVAIAVLTNDNEQIDLILAVSDLGVEDIT